MSELFKKYSIKYINDGDYIQHYFGDKEIFGTSVCEAEVGDFVEAVGLICEEVEEENKRLSAIIKQLQKSVVSSLEIQEAMYEDEKKMKEFIEDCAVSHEETRYKYRAQVLLRELNE